MNTGELWDTGRFERDTEESNLMAGLFTTEVPKELFSSFGYKGGDMLVVDCGLQGNELRFTQDPSWSRLGDDVNLYFIHFKINRTSNKMSKRTVSQQEGSSKKKAKKSVAGPLLLGPSATINEITLGKLGKLEEKMSVRVNASKAYRIKGFKGLRYNGNSFGSSRVVNLGDNALLHFQWRRKNSSRRRKPEGGDEGTKAGDEGVASAAERSRVTRVEDREFAGSQLRGHWSMSS